MSNRVFQGSIHQMRDFIDRTIGVIDDMAHVVACSDLSKLDSSREYLAPELKDGLGFARDGYTYRPLDSLQYPEFYVFVEGTDETAARYAGILAVSITGIQQYYDKKYVRSTFIKNVVLDTILPGDVYIKARELQLGTDVPRAVLLVRIVSASGASAVDVIQNLFPDKQKDFVFSVSGNDIVVVREVPSGVGSKDLEEQALTITDTLSGEYGTRAVIGIGRIVADITDLSRSFNEAQTALNIGKVFDTEKAVFGYDNLGIARLIYQLPTGLCTQFLREVFAKGSLDSLDRETMSTIQKFFENNLNISETSRKLFIHRSTLVYRLEKVKKITGLDLREFDQAIIFKIALMVRKHLDANLVKH